MSAPFILSLNALVAGMYLALKQNPGFEKGVQDGRGVHMNQAQKSNAYHCGRVHSLASALRLMD
jgi:hypothetical protein